MTKNHTEIVILTPSNRALPALVTAAGPKASRRFVEFFTANIRNKNTREAYSRNINAFLAWCDAEAGMALDMIEPMVVAAYVEKLIKLTLSHVTQLEPIGLGKAKRIPCPHLVGIEPRAPDDHVIGLRRGIFVELRQTLRGDDSGETALAPLAHQTDDRLSRFRVPRAALGAINMRLIENDQCWPPEVPRQVNQ